MVSIIVLFVVGVDTLFFFPIVGQHTPLGHVLSSGQAFYFTLAQSKTQCLTGRSTWKDKTYGEKFHNPDNKTTLQTHVSRVLECCLCHIRVC